VKLAALKVFACKSLLQFAGFFSPTNLDTIFAHNTNATKQKQMNQ
jgi:hypothetical protein